MDTLKARVSSCKVEIGLNTTNLAEYVTDAESTAMCEDLNAIVDSRKLDDDGTVLLRFNSEARGILMSSQIAVGEENNLRLRVYGDAASIDWSQMEPNSLWLRSNTQSTQLIRTGVGDFCPAAQSAMRVPAGHPEGYLEAFANIYQNFAKQILAFEQGLPCSNATFDVPGIDEAIRGMAFIENTVKFSQSAIKWHDFDLSPSTVSGVTE